MSNLEEINEGFKKVSYPDKTAILQITSDSNPANVKVIDISSQRIPFFTRISRYLGNSTDEGIWGQSHAENEVAENDMEFLVRFMCLAPENRKKQWTDLIRLESWPHKKVVDVLEYDNSKSAQEAIFTITWKPRAKRISSITLNPTFLKNSTNQLSVSAFLTELSNITVDEIKRGLGKSRP